ncbi:Transcription initiation factor TFIID, subunit TAF11 [Trachipleistophora hominis]|uniref:Transcription initiation factor TFIID subunit 11 n=1 Tax=Trachipleistophora hominis TaxID=72359 RepID=L7JZH0_TRAHO|nr:Transcription initiation factor TFIID, subunit TAF11 [Trachipleistophora hominis]
MSTNPPTKSPPPDPDNQPDHSSTTSSHTDTSTGPSQTVQLLQIVDQMTEPQLHRYESFRRSGFLKVNIKKLVNNVLNQACNPNFIIAVSGVAKVFVGEMVCKAKEVQDRWGDSGPLMPAHVHEAYRLLYRDMPNMKVYKRFFE